MWYRWKSWKFRVRTWNLSLIWIACFTILINPESPSSIVIQWTYRIPKCFDEDESFVFQSIVFDSQSKKLIIENKNLKNKEGKSRSEVNLANMRLSQIFQLHIASGDALHDSIGGIEAENARLKDWVKEL
jgi:hypothetical protein